MPDSEGNGGSEVPSPPSRGRRWWRDVVLVVATAVVVLVGQALLTGGDDDGDEDVATTETTDTTPPDDDSTTTGADEGTTTTESDGGPRRNFEDGLWAVGPEIQPNRYIATGIEGGCSWARLSDATRDNVIVAEEDVPSQAIVEILDTDAAFRSQGCGVWEVYEPRETPPLTTINDGDWVVGDQVEAGTYQVEAGSGCAWTHAAGFEHTAAEVIDHAPAVPRSSTAFTVELAVGQRFTSRECGTWVKLE